MDRKLGRVWVGVFHPRCGGRWPRFPSPAAKGFWEDFKMYGTTLNVTWNTSLAGLPTRNWTMGTFARREDISAETYAETMMDSSGTCWACAQSCKRDLKSGITQPWSIDPRHGGPEYETVGMMGSNCLVGDLAAIAKAKVDVRDRPDAVVQTAFVGFPGLLRELGLSPQAGQTISIKVEVDTNPPSQAVSETSIVRRHVLLNLLHYDKPSLLAGMLHALIHRSHVKGRDVYNLEWYLSDPSWPEPNLLLLQASLARTGMTLSDRQVADWRSMVAGRVAAIVWDRVVADVSPFLERSEDAALLTRDNVLGLLQA